MSAARAVLDSFALLAFLRGEPGEETIASLLERAGVRDEPVHMSEVNYAEVKYITIREDGKERWDEIAGELPALPIEFHPATRALSDIAAEFKARYSISLADAFAAALAKERKAQLITGDPEFKALEKEIKIGWLE
ncbi:MAG TPA: PIN domain-containing protein [Chthoniobacterales bacterium]|nr:PIN domain-containing protein [Chthoniobacterales bacterium]